MGGSMGERRRREVLARVRLRDRARHAAAHRLELRRRPHAGGDPLADAAAEDDLRGRGAARRGAADVRRARASDHRRRARELRVARRRDDRRARRADRVHRPARRSRASRARSCPTTSRSPSTTSASATSTPSSPDPSSVRTWRGSCGSLNGDAERRLREPAGPAARPAAPARHRASAARRRASRPSSSGSRREATDEETSGARSSSRGTSERPYTLDYVERILDDWVELHGDRGRADDGAIVAGIGKLDGRTVALIGHQKGRDVKERHRRQYGMAVSRGLREGDARDGARGALRLPGRDARRHARRVPRRRRRAARPGRRDRPLAGDDAAARRADGRLRDRRGRLGRRRSRSPSPTAC